MEITNPTPDPSPSMGGESLAFAILFRRLYLNGVLHTKCPSNGTGEMTFVFRHFTNNMPYNSAG